MLDAIKEAGISAENLVLGMGGALLQKLNRDTQNFAIKCSHAVINDEEVIVQKRPIEMNAEGKKSESFKRSKGGKLKLIKDDSGYKTVQSNEAQDLPDQLITVFENGVIKKEWTFEEIRKRSRKTLKY